MIREFLEAYAAAGDAREAALARASMFAWLIGATALACIALVNLGRTLARGGTVSWRPVWLNAVLFAAAIGFVLAGGRITGLFG